MNDFFARVWTNLIGRSEGPMHFRLILQPLMACIFAVRSGLRDARENKPPFLWSQAFDPAGRSDLRRQAWKDIGKVLVAAVILDILYQVIQLRTIYLGKAIVVAILLALVPYLFVRSAVARFARRGAKAS